VLSWNTDKHYLATLAHAGIPVVPTTYVTAVSGVFVPPAGEYVVKPIVSAAAMDTARYGPGADDVARRHVERLLASGRGVMVQPYVHAVEEQGETSVFFVGGEYSHGARKEAVLAGDKALSPELTVVGPHEPSQMEREMADAVLAAVDGPLLYARVDLLPGPDGPMLLELELTESFLFLDFSAGAAARFAAAIARWP
jgi:hypothetical protein